MKLKCGVRTSMVNVFLAVLLLVSPARAWGSKHQKVRLNDVKALTLRQGQYTTHRRVHRIPQLTCRGRACRFYHIDTLRCINAGASYNSNHPEWTCTADVPKFFRLTHTDVHCEGYESSEDPFILGGSCGAEYRLAFTDEGADHYGNLDKYNQSHHYGHPGTWIGWLFKWSLISLVVGYVAWAVWRTATEPEESRRARRARRTDPGAPDWRGGGGGGGGPPHDPPPPYDPHPPPYQPRRKPPTGNSQSSSNWRPGFWSGLAGGAAGGYLAGQRSAQARGPPAGHNIHDDVFGPGMGGGRPRRDDNTGEGPSSRGTYTATGYGSTVMR